MSKNECNKTRPVDNPYEIWRDESSGFVWKVLKKYQNRENEAKNPHARWFCAVSSPFTWTSYELGDVYVSEIKEYGIKDA